jgi:hypothetical protein
MMNWIKNNKLASVLLVILAFFTYQLFKSYFGISPLSIGMPGSNTSYVSDSASLEYGAPTNPTFKSAGSSAGIALPNIMPSRNYAPQADVSNRLVIQESDVSLLVKDVVDTRNKILQFATSKGGYMVTASTSNPQDAPTANVTIRIPSDKLQESLDFFHSLSVKVVSENLLGQDVTDQYVDIDTRIKLLESTKARYEDILSKATEINDITNLTSQILNIQSQIDSYKGQQSSLEKNAKLAKLTVYMSTDEIALPYAPSDTFRPNVIFKLAVRSLVKSLRSIATYFIWIVVYSVVWVPLLLLYVFIRNRMRMRQNAK